MKLPCSRSWFAASALIVIAFVTTTQAQAPAAQEPPKRVIINFLVPIDTNTVNLLLAVVNNQMRAGVKNITIVISSSGGDPLSAFAAYNILHNLPVDITTFNAGVTDSAAMLIYCAGKHRYSLPGPARFLIHGSSMAASAGLPMDANFMEAQLLQLKSINQMLVQVLVATSNKPRIDLEKAVAGQAILSPEEAVKWGIVQEVRTTFMEEGAIFVSVNQPQGDNQTPTPAIKFSKPPIISKTAN